jgi:hypothetical protein
MVGTKDFLSGVKAFLNIPGGYYIREKEVAYIIWHIGAFLLEK